MNILGGYDLQYELIDIHNITVAHNGLRDLLGRVREEIMDKAILLTAGTLSAGSALVGFHIANKHYMLAALSAIVTFEIVRYLFNKLFGEVAEEQPKKRGRK